jgi:hypothetical protein
VQRIGLALTAYFLAFGLSACQRPTTREEVSGKHADPSPSVSNEATLVQQSESQRREEEFRWKERCASNAERIDRLFASPPGRSSGDTSVSEVFYSPKRNSCICEVSVVGKGGKTGVTNLLTLYDCLTREELGTTLLQIGTPDFDHRATQWAQTKADLK